MLTIVFGCSAAALLTLSCRQYVQGDPADAAISLCVAVVIAYLSNWQWRQDRKGRRSP